MKLLTKADIAKLTKNYAKNDARISKGEDTLDLVPVVKLFTPWTNCTWLLTELGPDGIAFGLCDLGSGYPELGYVSIAELASIKGRCGLKIERDRWFTGDKPISEYAADAREKCYIAA